MSAHHLPELRRLPSAESPESHYTTHEVYFEALVENHKILYLLHYETLGNAEVRQYFERSVSVSSRDGARKIPRFEKLLSNVGPWQGADEAPEEQAFIDLAHDDMRGLMPDLLRFMRSSS